MPVAEPNDTSSVLVLGLLDAAAAVLEQDTREARRCIEQASSLLKQTARACTEPSQAAGPRQSCGLAPWQTARIARHIEWNIDARTSVPMLATLVGLSTSYFSRAFQQSFGLTPHAYIIRCRVDRAKELMLRTDDALAEIALASGFNDQANFSRIFRRLTGETPNAWRRNRRAPRCQGDDSEATSPPPLSTLDHGGGT
ncbi:MAG TPA: AraC family transcriptional regulator [Aliidongia sp.]|nr:AraC family transcriptional regulator [Aliidongia sp.]